MQDKLTLDIVAESLTGLELPGVLEEVAAHAQSGPGRERVLLTSPAEDMDCIRSGLDLTAEFKEFVSLEGPLGLGDLVPMEGMVSRLENPAVILEAEEILAVKDVLEIAAIVRQRVEALPDRFVRLKTEVTRINPLDLLRGRILAVLDEHGAVRPTAGRRLMEIHDRTRTVRDRIKKRLDGIVHDRDLTRIVQEDYVTLRNDRYVILLRPEFKGLLEGIIHDHSRSGASVYVEPFDVVEFNNQVASLMDEERDEIRRIMKDLTDEIRSVRDELLVDYETLARLDAFQARALYSGATSGIVPELIEDGFRIIGARHPLLLATGDSEVVPMDVIQDPATSVTVISGANMGGKTVALKIAGLFPLMTRCAIMIPAREGTKITPFLRVMADIGEDQDIRGRVSSFSSHVQKIKAIVDTVDAGDLVLLDELGSATDPEEGSALAMAVLDELIRLKTRVVVTTHLTHLKAYALSRPEVRNVSVEFHPQTLQPTFRLLYDLPGESHAIETAERMGLAERVIDSARRYADKAAGGSSRLLEQLREKLSEVEQTRQTLREEQERLDRELEQIRSSREQIVEGFRREARDLIRNAERQIAEIQESMKKGRMKKGPAVKEALAKIREESEHKLGIPLEKEPEVLPVGSRVGIRTLGREGTVKAVLDRNKVEIALGSLSIRTHIDDLDILDRGPAKKIPSKKEQVGVDIPIAAPAWQVNVIGLRVDEALPIVEKALDEAVLAGLPSISIIHGKGTGRLRKAVWDYLTGHSLVRDFRSGDIQQGGAGVTVVQLPVE